MLKLFLRSQSRTATSRGLGFPRTFSTERDQQTRESVIGEGKPSPKAASGLPTTKSTHAAYKELVVKYGLVATVFHSSVYAVTLAGFYGALHYNYDISSLVSSLESLPLMSDFMDKIPEEGSTFALAYAFTFCTNPVRIGLDFALVPPLARLESVKALSDAFAKRRSTSGGE